MSRFLLSLARHRVVLCVGVMLIGIAGAQLLVVQAATQKHGTTSLAVPSASAADASSTTDATPAPAVPVVASTNAGGGAGSDNGNDVNTSGTSNAGSGEAGNQGSYERAVIEQVTSGQTTSTNGGQQIEAYTIRFLSGPLQDQTRVLQNDVGSNPYGVQPRIGDKVVIFIQSAADGSQAFYIEGYDRRAALIWLLVLFVIALMLLAGWQGIKVAVSIAISIGLIGYVLIPAFLRGVNPIPVAIFLGGVFTLVSSGLSVGWNRKTYVTAIGTMGGVLISYLISTIFAGWAHVNGLSTEEDRLFFSNNPHLNPTGLLFAGIIIASLGVVEDVAVSIVSGVAEVKRANQRLSFRQLFQSGMTIGNDHMSALANTLVYAYVGGSLSTLLLYGQFGGSWLKFVNFDSVVDEIIRSLAGTMGLVFTVPITALLAAWVYQKRHVTDEEAQTGHSHIGHTH